MAKYLFIHQNYPGQFPHISKALIAAGHQVVALGEHRWVSRRPLPHPEVQLISYPTPDGAGEHTHHYLKDLEAHTRRGQAVFRALQSLKQQFIPDVVVAHPGWGEAMFLHELFPSARHIRYLEFFYQAQGADIGFDPQYPVTVDDVCRTRLKNTTQLLSFDGNDEGVSPTAWQKTRYPADWQPRIQQIHEGINTDQVRPNPSAVLKVGHQRFSRQQQIITYVARNLEPYRGFHTLMRAIPRLLQQNSRVQILIVGGDDVSYGKRPPDGMTYRTYYQKDWPDNTDLSRVHFLGRLPYADYLSVLQISSVHIYLTYPFVLSWSMLEAMSAGCVVLGSATPPVQEVIHDGVNGILTDFFDAEKLADRSLELLNHRQELQPMREAARATICRYYDLKTICLPAMMQFLRES